MLFVFRSFGRLMITSYVAIPVHLILEMTRKMLSFTVIFAMCVFAFAVFFIIAVGEDVLGGHNLGNVFLNLFFGGMTIFDFNDAESLYPRDSELFVVIQLIPVRITTHVKFTEITVC